MTVADEATDDDFNESYYLDKNPDIKAAIARGDLSSGLDHYRRHGKAEGRIGAPAGRNHQLWEAERELADVFEKHNGANFLTPHDLTMTPTTLRQIVLIGPCGTETMNCVFSKLEHRNVDFVHRLQRSELPDAMPRSPSDYDFQVVEIALRSLFFDGVLWSLPYNDVEAYQQAFERAASELRAQIKASLKWNEVYGLLTFVSNFAKPQENPLGRLLPKYDIRNPAFLIEKLNEILEQEALSYKNVYVLDMDGIKASYGRRFVQDDSYEHINHHSFMGSCIENYDRAQIVPSFPLHYHNHTEELMKGVWNYLLSLYRSVKQVDAVKLVVVDLDDTMWKGVSGEADLDVTDVDMLEGWPLGIWEALAFLKKRGILLAIISKNDETRIRGIWGKIIGKRFDIESFAVVKINWRPKAENMREILSEVNLLPRSTLFIDDHPVERAAMQNAFPDMRVIGRFHYYWRRVLLWSSETQVPFVTEESSKRTEMVQAQIQRDASRGVMSREEFLASLGLTMKLWLLNGAFGKAFDRAFELINKTNQFNTTGRRWPRADFDDFVDQGGKVYVFDVEDKFTPYGIVGVVLVMKTQIEQFVMSCRIAGMDNELAAMALVLEDVRASHGGAITASFKETDANFLCRDFLERCGFQQADKGWTLESASLRCPAHVTVEKHASMEG